MRTLLLIFFVHLQQSWQMEGVHEQWAEGVVCGGGKEGVIW